MAHIRCSFYSPSLLKNANVIVYLPTVSADDYLFGQKAHYGKPGACYQTLYLLHGSYGDYLDWCRLTGIERYAQEHCVAVVMPSAENSSYVDMACGEKYLTYITRELPEFLGKLFPLSPRREDTFIAGLSMGGYGAFRCALEHPGAYGAAASLSGGLDMPMLQNSDGPHVKKMPPAYRAAVFQNPRKLAGTRDDLPVLLKERLAEGATLPELYMSCGTEDFIYPANESFYEAATAMGARLTYERFPGVHDWNYWDAHIRDVLSWLPLKGDLV